MSKNAQSKLTTHDDGKFVRTAITVTDTSSIDILNAAGERIGQINLFASKTPERDLLMVDVIDVEDRYTDRRAITFLGGAAKGQLKAGKLVAAHFEKPAPEPTEPVYTTPGTRWDR